MYCLLSAGASFAISLAYFRGVEFPRRLRRHGADRVTGDSASRGYGGYGYGVGNGYGISSAVGGVGKRD